MEVEEEKKAAALAAVRHVRDGMILGVGSGSTVAFFIEVLASAVKKEKLEILCVPTSYQSAILLAEHGIPLTSLIEHPTLDLTVDGADEIDPNLNLIKGRGGALTLEKIVASSSEEMIVIADSSKLVEKLGVKTPVPVEVIPVAWKTVAAKLAKLGARVELRHGSGKVGPTVTDNGNFILDAKFPRIDDPGELEEKINNIPGVVENGLFVEIAKLAYLGRDKTLKRNGKT
ncbi:MAG: ribose-5-phosphate isomerase RpiA [Candidatus Jordarchaeales archaeon]